MIVGCQSDPECPTDKACHNTRCVDPCNCGINAICQVINHKPLCYCPPGYSGNPEIECQKRKLIFSCLKNELKLFYIFHTHVCKYILFMQHTLEIRLISI